MWLAWADAIAALGLRRMVPRLVSAAENGRLPASDMSFYLDDLERAEAAFDDPQRLADLNMGYIDDVLRDVEWLWLEDENEPSVSDARSYEPAHNPYRNVGRNDPCPCGSGKKFKKCCLDKAM